MSPSGMKAISTVCSVVIPCWLVVRETPSRFTTPLKGGHCFSDPCVKFDAPCNRPKIGEVGPLPEISGTP